MLSSKQTRGAKPWQDVTAVMNKAKKKEFPSTPAHHMITTTITSHDCLQLIHSFIRLIRSRIENILCCLAFVVIECHLVDDVFVFLPWVASSCLFSQSALENFILHPKQAWFPYFRVSTERHLSVLYWWLQSLNQWYHAYCDPSILPLYWITWLGDQASWLLLISAAQMQLFFSFPSSMSQVAQKISDCHSDIFSWKKKHYLKKPKNLKLNKKNK